MPLRTLSIVVLLASASLTSLASVGSSSLRVSNAGVAVTLRERRIWASAVHDSEFAAIPHTARVSCAAAQPPQALATPNPLLDQPDPNGKITVSFIIGADGRVYSPLILESAGPGEDRTVLNAVRSWRYRPAMCNGVPTEAEGKIEFSSR